MTETYKTNVSRYGQPVTGLRFNDFVPNEYLDNKTCLLEVDAGSYVFFKTKDELIKYKKSNNIRLTISDWFYMLLNKKSYDN